MSTRMLGMLAMAKRARGLLFVSAVASCTTESDVVARFRDGGVGPGGAVTSGEVGSAGRGGAGPGTAGAAEPDTVRALELGGDLEAHDSSVIELDGGYRLFYTGAGIPTKVSGDLTTWVEAGRVFSENPAWIKELVPDATDLWAPDVAHVEGRYHLYYAASTFGSGRSCIGHASAESLAAFTNWEDHGAVICSDLDGAEDDWDAIDPSQVTDAEGGRWLVFGSFGSGIKAIPLDEEGQREGTELYSLAARPEEPHAIQAPFALYRQPYYYLFVSFDWCCRGVSSTYEIRVGRSPELLGPYVDREGSPLLKGGGTLLLAGNERWRGVGANALLTTRGRDYVVYHAYDANAAGRATLRIAEVAWDAEAWPVLGGP